MEPKNSKIKRKKDNIPVWWRSQSFSYCSYMICFDKLTKFRVDEKLWKWIQKDYFNFFSTNIHCPIIVRKCSWIYMQYNILLSSPVHILCPKPNGCNTSNLQMYSHRASTIKVLQHNSKIRFTDYTSQNQ